MKTLKSLCIYFNVRVFTLIIAVMVFTTGCQRTALTESTDPKEAIVNAYKNLTKAESYYLKANQIDGGSSECFRKRTDEFWSKKLMIGRTKETVTMESMWLGTTEYKRFDQKEWLKLVGRSEKSVGAHSSTCHELELRDTSKFSNAKFVEKSKLDSEFAYVYTYDYAGDELLPNQVSEKIWISADSGLPLKLDRGIVPPFTRESIKFDYSKKIDLKPPITE